MPIFDLAIIETGNGGDFQLVGNDLAVVNDVENMIYLCLFGGNLEESTVTNFVRLQYFDFWGNNLFHPNDTSLQFNSDTERVMNSVALNSSGRVLIENAMKNDLKPFSDFGATVEVSVTIISTDKISCSIKVKLPDQQKQKITIINFRKSTEGDFFILDFNEDFFI